jgi:hypothetical protein
LPPENKNLIRFVREDFAMNLIQGQRAVMRGALTAFAALLLLGAASTARSQETIKLTMAAGHPPIFLWVKHLKESLMATVDAELAKTGKYKIAWTEAYGGTLAKIGSDWRRWVGFRRRHRRHSVPVVELPLNNVTISSPTARPAPTL